MQHLRPAVYDLFAWLARHDLTIAGPALEEHLIDADGGHAVVLDVPGQATSAAPVTMV
ncbi:hypothetical protein [Acrocarpospora catenulata]|uniref:hypothetical protein n=1 Tax=Acrocarpospora catenulata TaxID=2836182 RepID=UPI001BD924D3|nr:hypothetical protein [Acrocarpospora catenulata]